MGLFSKTEPVIIEGVIARIGIISHGEYSLVYGIHLQNRRERFWVDANVGSNGTGKNTHITMAERGDRVRFGTHPKNSHEAIGVFENLTMKSDLG